MFERRERERERVHCSTSVSSSSSFQIRTLSPIFSLNPSPTDPDPPSSDLFFLSPFLFLRAFSLSLSVTMNFHPMFASEMAGRLWTEVTMKLKLFLPSYFHLDECLPSFPCIYLCNPIRTRKLYGERDRERGSLREREREREREIETRICFITPWIWESVSCSSRDLTLETTTSLSSYFSDSFSLQLFLSLSHLL